jgi:hypothetical protein
MNGKRARKNEKLHAMWRARRETGMREEKECLFMLHQNQNVINVNSYKIL